MLLTFSDAVERLVDYLGAQPADVVLRDSKMACIEALRDLTQSYTWQYLYTHGRINTTGPFDCGTVTYQCHGGMYPYQLTLTGGCWPDWAAFGTLRIGNINYDVVQRVSGTILLLSPTTAPQCDITTPTCFGLYRDSYLLPEDFQAQDTTFSPQFWGGLQYVHPREWLKDTSRWGLSGNPCMFSVMADPDYGGRFCIKLAPFPGEWNVIDFLYKRRAAPLLFFKACQGTVSTAAGSSTFVGTGTAFTTAMECGTVIRLSDNTQPPTPEWGDNPAIFESKVVSVNPLAQTITLLDAVPATYATAMYTISSWVDITTGTMTQAFLRGCEHHISMSRTMKDKPSAHKQYETALEIAKCADSRSNAPRYASVGGLYHPRLKDLGPVNLGRES